MNLLVLGGTQFVGRAIVEAALAADHTVAIFHRGRHETRFSSPVETLRGDRADDLSALRDRAWDAVIDTSGYAYEHVRASAELLAASVGHYTFVSTISVYADFGERGITEAAPLKPADLGGDGFTPAAYGEMKVACERAVAEAVPGRHLIVRPGIIVGPDDYTDRFPFWCRRVAAGGEVLCAGEPTQPVQWIDARDLGEWMVRATAGRLGGVFNATGPAAPVTMIGLLKGIRGAAGSDATFSWVPAEFLQAQGSSPGRDFPFHVPEEGAGIFAVDSRRAQQAGLRYRPLDTTARDTLAWDAHRPDEERTGGISHERERELLRAWRAQR